ncbi:MAG TPA: putative sulfate exporter family transporter [Verrucomicrobiae bacterium]|nr:putative sulfate exporter family transporter [Verrucomicrobiae bacterium]
MNERFFRLLPAGGCGTEAVLKIFALVAAGVALMSWGSPGIALAGGILFAAAFQPPAPRGTSRLTRYLLQGCVVLLGFGMDLPTVLRLGMNGAVFAAATIAVTLLAGRWLGKRLRLPAGTAVLISAGTAICGGSAIAALSSVIAATEAEIAVSIGTVFLLNAVALYLFPAVGHCLHLTQAQFGLWAGVGIHDISSVVGAGLSYGHEALNAATAIKLSRTLWIVPLTLIYAAGFKPSGRADGAATHATERPAKIAVPWFIILFLLASLVRSWLPVDPHWFHAAAGIARHGMILVLFLVGTSLSLPALRVVGWRTVAVGLALWFLISAGSLSAILLLKLAS